MNEIGPRWAWRAHCYRAGPTGTLTPQRLGQLKRHKFEVLVVLHFGGMVTTDVLPPEVGQDGWPVDTIDPDEITPCPHCGTFEAWQAAVGDLKGRTDPVWRCLRCDPPRKFSERSSARTT